MKDKQKLDVSDLLIESRLVFTDPLYFVWMYNRLLGHLQRNKRDRTYKIKLTRCRLFVQVESHPLEIGEHYSAVIDLDPQW